MKFLKIILLILLFSSISCKKQEALKNGIPSPDSVIVYNESEYYKNKNKKLKIVDTMCIFGETRAKKDVRRGKLIYTLVYGFGSYDYSNKEMKSLLSRYSITLDSILIPCSRPPKGFRWNCYAELMNSEIKKKLGDNLIDSLRTIADKKFIENNPYFVFNFHECETTSRYDRAKTYEEFLKKPENDFVNELNYPKLSKVQVKKEMANTEVFFVIYKDGRVGNIEVQCNTPQN